MLHVTSAKYLNEHRIWCAFDDNSAGEIDLAPHLDGPIFKPLTDQHYFSQMKFDPELATVVWPNGADFAPEYLCSLLKN